VDGKCTIRRSLASDEVEQGAVDSDLFIIGQFVHGSGSLVSFCSGKDAQKHSALVGTRIINGQPGHSVVGPGWLQLRVSNCPFVTRPAVRVHCAGIRLSLEHHRPPERL